MRSENRDEGLWELHNTLFSYTKKRNMGVSKVALRTVEQYRQGLKDDRVVYMLGKRVPDVTEDPYIKVGVETAAFDFLMGHDENCRNYAVIQDPETGGDISAYFEMPISPEWVEKRFKLVNNSCYYADGIIPFVKDVGTDIINGLTVTIRVMGNKTYEQRINDYRWYCARNDLSIAGLVTDVKGDRSKSPHAQVSPDYYLRVVDETADEIVVSGAKAHITAGAYVDEFIVIPTRNFTEKDKDYAIAFAVPANTKGITQVCRPSFRFDDKNYFPTPKPRRGHIESLVIFDNVRIPKERVFMKGEWKFAQLAAYSFASFHRYTAVTYKISILELLTGLGIITAEANGIDKSGHVRDKIVNMVKYTETTKALALAALYKPENFMNSGCFVSNRLICNMAKLHFATGYHEFTRDIQDIAGGLIVTQPTYQDWLNPALNPYLERYMGGGNGWTAERRMKLMSNLHHFFASDFSGWHAVCTIHAEGSQAAQKMMLLAEAPIELYRKMALENCGLEA